MTAPDPLEIQRLLATMGIVTRPGTGEALLHIWGAVVGPCEQDLGMRLLLSQRQPTQER
jgi:hypothetical protein